MVLKLKIRMLLKQGDDELFLVEDAETAESVIETVMEEYSPDGAQINNITVDKKTEQRRERSQQRGRASCSNE